jgi:hypothetical protein
VLLDTSAAMAAEFEPGVSKLDAARRVVSEQLGPRAESDVLGLRAYGHPCAGSGDQLVPMDLQAIDSIEQALDGVEASGHFDLVGGVIGASGDLINATPRLNLSSRNLLVITAEGDDCHEDSGDAVAEIRRRIEDEIGPDAQGNLINLEIHVIGLGVPDDRRVALEALEELSMPGELPSSVDAKLYFADDMTQLAETVGSLLSGVPSAARPREPVVLYDGPEAIDRPNLAVDEEGTIHVTWEVGFGNGVAHRYLPPGEAWSEAEIVSGDHAFAGSPRLIPNPDGNVCLFWSALRPDGLYVRCWLDGRWSDPEVAEESKGLTAEYAPAFAPDGTPQAVFGIPPSFIGFKEIALTVDGVTAGDPAFAVDAAGGFHAAWRQFANQTEEIGGWVHRYSSDGGVSWGDPESIDEEPFGGPQLVPDEVGGIHWLGSGGTYRRWTQPNGWGGTVDIDPEAVASSHLTVSPSGLASAVFATPEGVFTATQAENGTWREPELVEVTRGVPSDAAVLAIDAAGRQHLVWRKSAQQPTLLYLMQGGASRIGR